MKFATMMALGLLLVVSVYAKPMLLIIDASGSMAETLASGKTKLATAQEVAIQTINGYNDKIALMVYTDCDSGGDPLSGGISVWNGFTTDKQALIAKVNSITASDYTPIANSILEGTTYIKQNGNDAQIVLLTDGQETCDGDVSSAVSTAQGSGINVKVVGFALDNLSAQNISTSVTSGGGKYYNAEDAQQLQQAFTQATSDPGSTSCCVPAGILGLAFAGAFITSRRN